MALPSPYTAAPRVGRLTSRFRGIGLLTLVGIAACGAGSDGEPGDDFARSTRAREGREIALSSSFGTAQSGSVNFRAEGDSLLVSVELVGLGAGAHQGFIRHGQSCDSPGAAVTELPTVTGSPGGTAVATQRIGIPEVPAGAAVVTYHEPGQTPGHVILCGRIAAEADR